MCRVFVVFCTLSCCLSLTAGGPSPIAVFMNFQSEPSPEALSQMEREITEIMKPSGLAFDWRMIKDHRLGESFSDLVVLTFKGHCQMAGPTYDELGPLFERQPLAYTRISEGHVLPFSDVQCDTIRNYIAPNMAAAHPADREGILGRALGRVVAHEMYHMLASTTIHAEDGVARSFHTRKDLTAPEFHFTQRESQLLRELKSAAPKPSREILFSTSGSGGS